MASKYEKVMKDLPKLEATKGEFDNPKYQEKVNAEKLKVLKGFEIDGGTTPQKLAIRFRELRARKEQIEAQLSEVNLEIEAVSQLLCAKYEEEGLSSIGFLEGGKVNYQPQPVAIIKDKESFRQWCKNHGMEREMVLPWQTSNSLVKDRLVNGEPTPEGVEIFVRPALKLYKK